MSGGRSKERMPTSGSGDPAGDVGAEQIHSPAGSWETFGWNT